MMMFKCCVTVLTLVVGYSVAANPGIKTVFTSKGLSYFDTVGLPLLKQDLQNVKISDISGTADVNIIGSIDYSLSNIQLSDLEIASSDITTGTSGITVQASGVSISSTADWSYKKGGWIHVSDSGSADLTVSDVAFSVSVLVDKDNTGHAVLRATGCSLTVGDVEVEFHGGASWLYNLFDGTIESLIKEKMQDQLCTAASSAINDKGSLVLESLPDTVQVDEIAELSYALISSPMFTSDYIETEYKGEFMSIANPVDVPFSPQPLPKLSSYDRMMYVWLTDYVANSAGVVYHNAGVLCYSITPDMIPENFPMKLNTGSFKFLLPKLYKLFRDMDMEVSIGSTKPPTMKVEPKSIDFMFTGSVDVSIVHPNKTKESAFALGFTLYADVRAWVSPASSTGAKQVLKANFTMLHVDLNLASSSIGNFSVKLLQETVNLFVKSFGIPLLNEKANVGLALPVIDGLSLVNSQLTLGDGYVVIDTDFSYDPSFMTRKKTN